MGKQLLKNAKDYDAFRRFSSRSIFVTAQMFILYSLQRDRERGRGKKREKWGLFFFSVNAKVQTDGKGRI